MGAKIARIDSWQLSVATLAQVSQSTHGILLSLGTSPRLRSLRHRSVQRGTAVLDCETWARY